MSATTTTVSGSTALFNNTNTSTTLSKVKTLQKMAAEEDSKRVANVAIQKRKLEVANKKAAQELLFKGKNAILKDKPSRPVRRPVKKNRKLLPSPSNKEHDTRRATAAIRAVIKTKEQLAALSNVRPSLNFDQIVEQRVVNGVVERIDQPVISQPLSSKPTSMEKKSRLFHSYADIIEQSVVNGVAESVPESADAPRAASLDIDTDSDLATQSDNDVNRDVAQLARKISTPEQCTDSSEDCVDYVEAVSATVSPHVYDGVPTTDANDEASKSVKEVASEVSFSCCPSAILSMPNAPLYPSRLSRDEEAALVAMQVAPVEIPGTVSNQQKLTKAEKKAAKAAEVSKEVTAFEFEGPHKQPKLDSADITTSIADPIHTADDVYFGTLLKMHNGPGVTKESRELHEKLVVMHVTPLSLPVTARRQQKTSNTERKAAKAGRKTSVDASAADKEPIIADYHAPAIAELNADDFTNDEETLIEDISKLGPLPFIKAEDDPQQVDGQVVDTLDKQTVVVPDDTTPVTPPASDQDPSYSGSDYLNSTKTSRRSSVESSAESIRRKTEKARTTILGKTSL